MKVFGLMTKPLVRLLFSSPKQLQHFSSMTSLEPSSPKSFVLPLLGNGQSPGGNGTVARPSSLRMLLTTPYRTVHYYWRKFDDSFMRPVFGGRGFTPYVPGSPTERDNNPQWQ
ncbi:hypothetical protein MLD38_010701 [Melastoma candidum]|uniref:Uncharacterized protein n=2 Tax=Melastoma candidum TaxID=119954 RepID=A0ACB9R0R0_9MYRT|nr:hypothetical protein MLD38_010701 [Melastoma candidum]